MTVKKLFCALALAGSCALCAGEQDSQVRVKLSPGIRVDRFQLDQIVAEAKAKNPSGQVVLLVLGPSSSCCPRVEFAPEELDASHSRRVWAPLGFSLDAPGKVDGKLESWHVIGLERETQAVFQLDAGALSLRLPSDVDYESAKALLLAVERRAFTRPSDVKLDVDALKIESVSLDGSPSRFKLRFASSPGPLSLVLEKDGNSFKLVR